MLLLCLPASVAAQLLPAFPGAEGHGRYTTGGRGGNVYHVTTLEDSEAKGTLRHAVKQKGARIIVFDVAGTIYLKSDLKISNDYITIAGQTAPGQGICIADYPVIISANDVILRYLRFRVGTDSQRRRARRTRWYGPKEHHCRPLLHQLVGGRMLIRIRLGKHHCAMVYRIRKFTQFRTQQRSTWLWR